MIERNISQRPFAPRDIFPVPGTERGSDTEYGRCNALLWKVLRISTD
jgi:hypothetical protein